MKAKWMTGLALGALLLGLVSGCGAAATAAALPEQVSVQKVQQVAMPVGDTFLGVVTPFVQTSVAPAISGILQTVNVRAGDKIQPGQVLATLNTDQLQSQADQAATGIQVAQAQKTATGEQTDLSVQNASAALGTAQAGLKNAETQGQNGIDLAQKNLAAAQAALSQAQTGSQNGVSQAQSAVASAQAQLDAATSRVATDLQVAQDNVTSAQNAENTAQTALAQAKQEAHSLTDPDLIAAQGAYDKAAIGYQTALGQLQAAQSDKSVSVAQAAYDQAESALQTAQSGKAVEVAQAAVNTAQQAVTAAQNSAASAVKSAQAQVAQAQTAYQTVLNNPALVVSDAQIQAAQAGLQTIQTNIDKGQIVAPIGGYVQAVNAQVGQAVGPQGGFVVIASMNPLQATVDVPEGQISQVKVGDEMDIAVSATGQTYKGTVSAIHPALDSGNAVLDNGNSNYPVDVLIEQPAAGLMSGMRVEAHRVNPAQKVILVPANSVLNAANGQGDVFVVTKGVAHRVKVKLGELTNLKAANGADYPVTSGLQDGQQVVVQGQNRLNDGDKVTISPSAAAAQG